MSLVVFSALSVHLYAGSNGQNGGLILAKNGRSHVAIYVSPDVMDQASAVAQRKQLRESVKDLAVYLERITGASVPVRTRMPKLGEKTMPILVGAYADSVFGALKMKTEFKQGYRLVVSSKGIGMQGETFEGVSYAIYELLDRLGCRWYMPGEMGEVIPRTSTLKLYPMDLRRSPSTVSRNIWYADESFRRRNRLGGFDYNVNQCLEGYITKDQLELHPDWNAEIGGKRELHACNFGHRICWANAEVSAAVADAIIAILDKNAVPCIPISPADGIDFCECDKCRALDTGDWDTTMSCVSITDRYINFCNRVAERVTQKHPNAKLGFLAYVQYTRPPKREKLHPALIPILAPLTYCRDHTIKDNICPSRPQLLKILQGWGKMSRNIAMYEYYYHLAEVSAPFPMIARNLDELPLQYANGVTMWKPETMPTFETGLPGLHIGIRMSWNSMSDPQAILNNFYAGFYGTASGAMRNYWQFMDDCWTKTPEHSGCVFGYMRRFTPERLTDARKLMDRALAACQTALEYRRVKLADDSLRQFELFMKMRRDYFSGRFADLEAGSRRWTGVHQSLAEEYAGNYAFAKTYWAPHTVAVEYSNTFIFPSYLDATRLSRDYLMLTSTLNTWRYALDREKNGEEQGWQQVNLDDKGWKTTDVAVDTWATLGLMEYYGPLWYRTQVDVPQIPDGKKVYLWVGATDGKCKVFVNGRNVPYRNDKGVEMTEAEGYCKPFSFDITEAVKAGTNNQISIIGTRVIINELGTGGLLGPVMLYREK